MDPTGKNEPGLQDANAFIINIDDVEELANRMENGSLLRFVQAYRTHGHRGANLDPLDIMQRE